MKNVFKTGLFYLVAFAMVLGNSAVSVDFSTPSAHAEGLKGIKPEVLAVKITTDPYPALNDVEAELSDAQDSVEITWTPIVDDRLNGYKVVMSEINTNPEYPLNPGDVLLQWIANPQASNYTYTGNLVCDQDYYFSVTARYDNGGHHEPGNSSHVYFACEDPEPNCVDADLEYVVDLEVMGLNCGSQNIPPYDYEDIDLGSNDGSYEVYTVVHRSGDNQGSPYGQDNEEFTIRVNSSSEGPVVLDQPAGTTWQIQNAGTFDFVNGTNTVHMDTAFECLDPQSMDRNSVAVTKLCLYEVDEPQVECGNGILESGEQCDDSNTDDNDGCSSTCQLEDDYDCEEITSQNGWYGKYYNYLASHPDMNLPSSQWPDDGHGDPMGSWDTDWYDNQYFKFNRVDSSLDFGTDYFPFDMAAEEIHNGHEYHFGAHWRAQVTPDTAGNFEFSLMSDDDAWVYLDGVLVADNAGIHAPTNVNGIMALSGNHIVDIFFAERHTVQSYMGFEFAEDTLTIVPMPEDCEEEPEECPIEDSLIVNGSFEEPVVTNNSLWQKMASVLGWIIEKVSDDSATTLELHRGWSNNEAAQGLQYSELDGDHSTRVVQNVATETGAQYKLFWSFAPRHNRPAEDNHLAVKVDGTEVASNGPVTGSAPLSQDDWEKSNYVFTATGNNTELAFEDAGPSDSFGTFLDDVRLCKIADPEPSDNPPVITLIGSPIVNVDHGSTYVDQGATADDVEDGDITSDIVTVNPVDTSNPGTYTITYNVADSDGNHATEVTRKVVVGAPYAPWCSVLLGAMKNYYDASGSVYLTYNDVIDFNDDQVVNLSDVAILAQMYYAGDNDVCYAQFEDPEDQYHFQCEDPNVGWCGGLVQGITDSINRPDRYFEVFDLYKGDGLGVINLSDLVLATQLNGAQDQVDCYSYYVPPFFMCENPQPYCELTLTKTDEGYDPIHPGEDMVYQLSIENTGTGVCGGLLSPLEANRSINCMTAEKECASGIILRDNFDADTTYVDSSQKPSYISTDRIEWKFDSLNPGERVDIKLLMNVSNKAQCAAPKVSVDDYTLVNTLDAWAGEIGWTKPISETTSVVCEDPQPYCGDGNVDEDLGEQCDGDAPQACTTDSGYAGTQSCNMPNGNSLLQSVEQTYCVWNECVTTEYCGDGIQNGSEQCDDGNQTSGDGCSSSCQTEGGGGGGGTSFAIRDLKSNISCEGFDISWRTTKDSDTILDLGTESGVYSQNIENDTNTRNHSLMLSDLLPNTTYYYQVRAINSTGKKIAVAEKSFTTPPAEQCEEVLGEKIEPEPFVCDFLRPSGSVGGDPDVDGVFQYPDGSLLRDACVPEMPVYLIRDQKKWHIESWQYLHDNHFGQRIYNVISTVVNSYEDWTGVQQILGIKEYADGTLLRGSDMKVYILEQGQKRHITSLTELFQYAGQEIMDVSDEVLERY